jgi:hypothetical protein
MATKFLDVAAGDKIIADGTHRCLPPGAVRKVYADDGVQKLMHVQCDCPTRHYLVADDAGNLKGFQKMRHQPAHQEPVSPNVYYDDGNFYYWGPEREGRRKGMGNRFYAKWRDRASEFKTKADVIAEWDAERQEAFKRIDEEFHTRRRRTKERLKWWQTNPSPRTDEEKLENLRRAIFEESAAEVR